jgi:hypothetical protein
MYLQLAEEAGRRRPKAERCFWVAANLKERRTGQRYQRCRSFCSLMTRRGDWTTFSNSSQEKVRQDIVAYGCHSLRASAGNELSDLVVMDAFVVDHGDYVRQRRVALLYNTIPTKSVSF